MPSEVVDIVSGANRRPELATKNPGWCFRFSSSTHGTYLTESLAIIHCLEEMHPDLPMIARSLSSLCASRARWRASER